MVGGGQWVLEQGCWAQTRGRSGPGSDKTLPESEVDLRAQECRLQWTGTDPIKNPALGLGLGLTVNPE